MKNFKFLFFLSVFANIILLGFIVYRFVDNAKQHDDLTTVLQDALTLNRSTFRLLNEVFIGSDLVNTKQKILKLKPNGTFEDESYDKGTYWVWDGIAFSYTNGQVTNVQAAGPMQ